MRLYAVAPSLYLLGVTSCSTGAYAEPSIGQPRPNSLQSILDTLKSRPDTQARADEDYTYDERGVRSALTHLTSLADENERSYRNLSPLKQDVTTELSKVPQLLSGNSSGDKDTSLLERAVEAYADGLDRHLAHIESRYQRIRNIGNICNLRALPANCPTNELLRRFLAIHKTLPSYKQEAARLRKRLPEIKELANR